MGDYSWRGIISAVEHNPYFSAVLDKDAEFQWARKQLAIAQAHKIPDRLAYPRSPLVTDSSVETFLADYAAAHRAEQEANAHHLAIAQFIRECADAITTAVSVDPNRLLAAFGDDMDALFDDAAGIVKNLKGATTAGDAINTGSAKFWKDLTDLRAEYDAIRNAQMVIMQCESTEYTRARTRHQDDPLAADYMIANLDEVWPKWRAEPSANLGFTVEATTPPWPREPIEQMIWLTSSNAKPWVPTLDQLNAVFTERHKRANPNPTVINPARAQVLNKISAAQKSYGRMQTVNRADIAATDRAAMGLHANGVDK